MKTFFLLVFFICVGLVFIFVTPSMASTIGVNVPLVKTISIEQEDLDDDGVTVLANLGLNEKLALAFGSKFNNEASYKDCYIVGGRYVIVNNLALAFKYITFKEDLLDDKWNLELRGKHEINDKLSLVGQLGYTSHPHPIIGNYEGVSYLGQAEYKMTNFFIPTLGVKHESYNNKLIETTEELILGMNLYFSKKILTYLDYIKDLNDSEKNRFSFKAEYVF